MNIDRQDADKILCPASFLRATLVEIMEVVMGPYHWLMCFVSYLN